MKTRCLIVDDEPLAIQLVESHISKIENLEIVAKCSNAMEAFEVIREKSIDLLFMDIQMPQITGIDFLRTLKNPPKIIITTAYRQYALEGYELDVIDFLLKPISFERFLKAVNKYYQSVPREINVVAGKTENGSDSSYVDVRENKKTIRIHLNEIKFIEGLNEYIGIVTDTKRIVTKCSLAKIEENLPSDRFIRIHKSFIVALSRIQSFSATSIEIDNKELPIGRSYKNIVLKTLNISHNL
ncbi:MAG: response regulator transcription factor [Bacteroidales bacterium]|nr:response regulator transcription factor [Bacteroidales bacterium]